LTNYMSRLRFTILIILVFVLKSGAQELTVREVVDKILESLDTEVNPGSVDTLKSGSWDQEVTGIATTFMTTFNVLKRAQSQGTNLILTHEPTFYNHLDLKDDYGGDDPIVQAKLDFIQQHNLVIFRFHDIPHQIEDDMIQKGLINKLGWEDYHLGEMIFDSPYGSVGELSQFLKDHFNTSTIRVVGDPEMKLDKIGILPGAYGRHGQIEAFNNPDIDALIVGESREWETVEYARDAQESGWKKALIVMGHADSEKPGMEYVAGWLKDIIPELPVYFIPARNPLWSPQ